MSCLAHGPLVCWDSPYIFALYFVAQDCVSSCKEEHGDVEESNTRVDQLSQDVTGSNPSVSNPCGDVTGPESLYQRPEVRIASTCM